MTPTTATTLPAAPPTFLEQLKKDNAVAHEQAQRAYEVAQFDGALGDAADGYETLINQFDSVLPAERNINAAHSKERFVAMVQYVATKGTAVGASVGSYLMVSLDALWGIGKTGYNPHPLGFVFDQGLLGKVLPHVNEWIGKTVGSGLGLIAGPIVDALTGRLLALASGTVYVTPKEYVSKHMANGNACVQGFLNVMTGIGLDVLRVASLACKGIVTGVFGAVSAVIGVVAGVVNAIRTPRQPTVAIGSDTED